MTRSFTNSILIVDDTPENLRLLIEILGKHGYHVRSAPNGRLALESVRKEVPDLILLDIVMPEIDGLKVCRRLKADESTRDIPVIFISALDEVFDKVDAFESGGVDYITKPFQVEEVLARVHTHLTLREMRQDLEKQNQELEAFAHTVAHDLKNPVATMISVLAMIQEDIEAPDASLQELMRITQSSAQKMNNIIDELLLLASVRKEEVALEVVNMQSVVESSLERLSHMIQTYHARVSVASTWPDVVGYAPWIEEVWVNYLSNAIKYGGNPPHLQLGADNNNNKGMVRFWVKDNGCGIEPALQPRLFAEFSRLEDVRAQGHGLGLSIVRRIIDTLSGQVGVESTLNLGSIFYFSLPTIDKT